MPQLGKVAPPNIDHRFDRAVLDVCPPGSGGQKPLDRGKRINRRYLVALHFPTCVGWFFTSLHSDKPRSRRPKKHSTSIRQSIVDNVVPSGDIGVKPTPAVLGIFNNRRCRLGVARNTDLAGVGRSTLSGISAGVGWAW
eukprot:1177775-Pyramimonas_sp.AAC.1